MKQAGKFIVIEGTDGSGKTVQFKKLVRRLKAEGFKVKTLDFPQYKKKSSYFIREYLSGKYGGWKDVSPYKASIFYALDRFDVSMEVSNWLKQGYVVLSNRYVASNMGHQGAKIKNRVERKRFLIWVYDLEYEILGIPKPDLNVFLHVPYKIAYKLIGKKGKREYIKKAKRDVHEEDIKHLKSAEEAYKIVAEEFPESFGIVECFKEGRLLSVSEIHKKIWDKIAPLLFKRSPNSEGFK